MNNFWNFIGNNFGQETGLNAPGLEMFKTDPISSLAREICQNSIDASINKGKVIVKFKPFTIKREEVPEIDSLKREIQACIDYQSKKTPKAAEELKEMLDYINNNDYINCLKISDFNTTGLTDVSSLESGKFYTLTKGSGSSEKIGTSGGSKGIGKYAAFVSSKFNTVFYSTYTVNNEEGSIGICHLCSSIKNAETGEKTQGIGYFTCDNRNSAISSQLCLDGEPRTSTGTDIYIIGFRDDLKWKKEMITKILDSFSSAIIFGTLEVKVDDVDINKETILDVIENPDNIIKTSYKNIKSQYILLTDNTVHKKELDIDGFGTATVYLKEFENDEDELSTNNCVMIRYPYMKITTLTSVSSVPCSAMCIIGDNTLNSILRDIENPQHTNWELKRITDNAKRDEVKSIKDDLTNKILSYINDELSVGDSDVVDMEGAGEFLSSLDAVNSGGNEKSSKLQQKPTIKESKKVKIKDDIGVTKNDDGVSPQPDIGEHGEGEGSPIPGGHNEGSGGSVHDTDKEGGTKDGDKEIMTYQKLSGMSYRYMMLDKNSGKCAISFESLYDESDCELSLYYLDDSENKYNVNIQSCTLEGNPLEIKDGKIVNLKLSKNKKYKLSLDTDLRELYSCEVIINACR